MRCRACGFARRARFVKRGGRCAGMRWTAMDSGACADSSGCKIEQIGCFRMDWLAVNAVGGAVLHD